MRGAGRVKPTLIDFYAPIPSAQVMIKGQNYLFCFLGTFAVSSFLRGIEVDTKLGRVEGWTKIPGQKLQKSSDT